MSSDDKNLVDPFGYAASAAETLAKKTFGTNYNYVINECRFSFSDNTYLNCDVLGSDYVDDIQREDYLTTATGYLTYEEGKLDCDVEDLIEEMERGESLSLEIEDQGEGSIFVMMQGEELETVRQAEEKFELFDEIIKDHTK